MKNALMKCFNISFYTGRPIKRNPCLENCLFVRSEVTSKAKILEIKPIFSCVIVCTEMPTVCQIKAH